VVRPLVLDWHTGERAGALAQYFGVELLPGAVLVPPYCKATECEVSWVDWFTCFPAPFGLLLQARRFIRVCRSRCEQRLGLATGGRCRAVLLST